MEFIYKEEFWYVSSFLNTSIIDGNKKRMNSKIE